MRDEKATSRSWLIFISHGGGDTWVARRIAERVEQCGATTFLDDADIAVGDDFEERILQALDSARELIVLLTPWSLERPYIWAEIGAAWLKHIPIVGVLHGMSPQQLHTQAKIPLLLKKRDLININDLDVYFTELRERIASYRARGA